jgi:hypothetical protein
MKRFMTLTAGAILAMTAFSNAAYAETEIDLSDRNGGLTKVVMCMNAPAQNGGTPGMYIPHIGWFVAAEAASITTAEDAIVMPVGISPKDGEDVTAYLMSVGLTNFELQIRPNRRTSTRLVEVATSIEVENEAGEIEIEPSTKLVSVTTTRRIPSGWCK